MNIHLLSQIGTAVPLWFYGKKPSRALFHDKGPAPELPHKKCSWIQVPSATAGNTLLEL